MILFPPPIIQGLNERILKAEKSIYIISPWLKSEIIEELITYIKKKKLKLSVLTRGRLEDFLNKSSDIEALSNLMDYGADVRIHKDIHAKIYIGDESFAILTSANLTNKGMLNAFEIGAFIYEDYEVLFLLKIFNEWKSQSLRIDVEWLNQMKQVIEENADNISLFDELKIDISKYEKRFLELDSIRESPDNEVFSPEIGKFKFDNRGRKYWLCFIYPRPVEFKNSIGEKEIRCEDLREDKPYSTAITQKARDKLYYLPKKGDIIFIYEGSAGNDIKKIRKDLENCPPATRTIYAFVESIGNWKEIDLHYGGDYDSEAVPLCQIKVGQKSKGFPYGRINEILGRSWKPNWGEGLINLSQEQAETIFRYFSGCDLEYGDHLPSMILNSYTDT